MRRVAGCHRIRAAAAAALGCCLSLGTPAAVAEPLAFHWPVPAQAEVVLQSERPGQSLATAMRLVVAESDGQLRVGYQDLRLLSMDGVDLSGPAMQARVAPSVAAVASQLPAFLIDRNGRFLDLTDLERMADAVVANLPAATDDAGKAAVRARLMAPEVQARQKANAAADWNAWVGYWIGRDPEVGADETFETQVEVFGMEVPARAMLSNHGSEPGRSDRLRLSLERVSEGAALTEAVWRLLSAAWASAGRDLTGLGPELIEQARRVERIEAITDPETLRPFEVSNSIELQVRVAGQEPRVQVERKQFRFDWDGGVDSAFP